MARSERMSPNLNSIRIIIDELKNSDHWPALIVTREMILIDGFHRLEAAKRRGDEEIEAEIMDITEEGALALAAKLNTTHGKRLTVLELAERIKLLIEEKGWSHRKAGEYFNKDHSWITHHVTIANNLDTTLVTRVTNLDYSSARELAKLPQNTINQIPNVFGSLELGIFQFEDSTILTYPIRRI